MRSSARCNSNRCSTTSSTVKNAGRGIRGLLFLHLWQACCCLGYNTEQDIRTSSSLPLFDAPVVALQRGESAAQLASRKSIERWRTKTQILSEASRISGFTVQTAVGSGNAGASIEATTDDCSARHQPRRPPPLLRVPDKVEPGVPMKLERFSPLLLRNRPMTRRQGAP